MTNTLGRVSTLLLAVAILLAGHGLQLTLLPMRAELLGWSTSAIGITGSSYFLGFVAGCLIIPSVVARVAHIRTFMVMGAGYGGASGRRPVRHAHRLDAAALVHRLRFCGSVHGHRELAQ